MNVQLELARNLRERSRHEQAIATLMAYLVHYPEDAIAHVELALNHLEIPGQLQQALQSAKTATSLIPDESYPLALQARILNRLEKHKEALALVDSAITLDPDEPYNWVTKCLIYMGLKQWAKAEEYARQALALDADDDSASALLSHVLRMQNKLDASEEETRRQLARNPENAFSFANAGWASLQRNDVKTAEGHFREALRLDPEMEHARDGLKEAYKGRSPIYRIFLKWAFFMQRFNQKNQWAIVIGIIIGFRLLRTLVASIHPLLVVPLAIAYYLFIFGTWLANPLGNLLILKDRVARHSLEPSEKYESLLVGFLFFGGIVALAIGAAFSSIPVMAAGGTLMIAALPGALIITNPSTKGRLVFGAASLIVLVAGAVMCVDMSMHPQREIFDGVSGTAFTWMIIAGVGSTWLASVKSLRQKTPE